MRCRWALQIVSSQLMRGWSVDQCTLGIGPPGQLPGKPDSQSSQSVSQRVNGRIHKQAERLQISIYRSRVRDTSVNKSISILSLYTGTQTVVYKRCLVELKPQLCIQTYWQINKKYESIGNYIKNVSVNISSCFLSVFSIYTVTINRWHKHKDVWNLWSLSRHYSVFSILVPCVEYVFE